MPHPFPTGPASTMASGPVRWRSQHLLSPVRPTLAQLREGDRMSLCLFSGDYPSQVIRMCQDAVPSPLLQWPVYSILARKWCQNVRIPTLGV